MSDPASLQLAWQYFRGNQLQPAESLCRRVLQADPSDAAALHLLGSIFNNRGQWQTASDFLRQSLDFRADVPEVLVALAIALVNLDRLDESHRTLTRAIELNPDDPDAHQNIGILQRRLGNLPVSAGHFERALALDPSRPLLRVYYAMVLRELGRFDESDDQIRLAVRLHPALADAHMQLAWNHLLRGRLAEGFAEYEWRWRVPGVPLPRFPQPLWTNQPLAGRSIMVHAEQGFGDSIQFVRYARMLAERGATVILYCHEPLRELLSSVPGVTRAVSEARRLPPFDFWCPLLSLPHRLGTTLDTVPAAVPYITPSAARLEAWAQRLRPDPSGFRVGLAWAGSRSNATHGPRSIPPDLLAPLSTIPGVILYSLQVERATPPSFPLIDHTPSITDFADTAALIAQLHLVISVDTAAAHLAGALAKETWTLLRPVPEWRWLTVRIDSPWYPTMTLFRSSTAAWEPLVAAVANHLANRAP